MSDFSELCPLFETGVYKELYLGTMTVSLWGSSTFNWLSSNGDAATAPSSLRFGRTIVVTEAFVKRFGNATGLTVTVCILFGRRTSSGTAAATIFGTATYSMSVSAIPNLHAHWQAIGLTSFTLATADVLNISSPDADIDAGMVAEIMIQYREK